MTNIEIKALENAGRTTAVWSEGYDGETHSSSVFRALAPALLVLAAIVWLMLAIL